MIGKHASDVGEEQGAAPCEAVGSWAVSSVRTMREQHPHLMHLIRVMEG